MVELITSLQDILYLEEDNNELLAFLLETKLVKDSLKCENCGNDCNIISERSKYMFSCHRSVGGRRCNFKRSLNKDTLFDKTKLSYIQVLAVAFCFSSGFNITQTSKRLNISKQTLVDLYKFFREVCIVAELNDQEIVQIGGENKIVEIGECKFGSCKSNHGWGLNNHWIYGAIEHNSENSFYVAVKNRNKETLLRLVESYIRPGTTVISDCWRSHDCLESEGFKKLMLNNSITFKCPESLYKENNDGDWWPIKRTMPACEVFEDHFAGYLAHHIWKMKHCHENLFKSFIDVLSKIY